MSEEKVRLDKKSREWLILFFTLLGFWLAMLGIIIGFFLRVVK